jgi:hypothetical protein
MGAGRHDWQHDSDRKSRAIPHSVDEWRRVDHGAMQLHCCGRFWSSMAKLYRQCCCREYGRYAFERIRHKQCSEFRHDYSHPNGRCDLRVKTHDNAPTTTKGANFFEVFKSDATSLAQPIELECHIKTDSAAEAADWSLNTSNSWAAVAGMYKAAFVSRDRFEAGRMQSLPQPIDKR